MTCSDLMELERSRSSGAYEFLEMTARRDPLANLQSILCAMVGTPMRFTLIRYVIGCNGNLVSSSRCFLDIY